METTLQKYHRKQQPITPGYWTCAGLIAVGMFALNIFNLRGQSITVDEYAHLPAGYTYVSKHYFNLYSKNPPLIKMIEALPLMAEGPEFPYKEFFSLKGGWAPWEFADAFVERNRPYVLRFWSSARVMDMLLGVCLSMLVFYWASRLYGARSGLLAMFLTATSPSILAHSGIATVDVGFALFFVLTWFLLWQFFEEPLSTTIIGAGVSFGAAQVSKFSGLLMIPILIVVLGIMVVRYELPGAESQSVKFSKRVLSAVVIAAIVFGMGLAIINAGYLARGTLEPLVNHVSLSSTLKKLAATGVGDWAMPLPADYIEGLDRQLADAERGEFPNYINGKWRRTGVWYYFLEAIGLKEPISALAMIILGLAVGIWRTVMRGQEIRPMRYFTGRGQPAWPFVHVPAIIFLAISSGWGNLQLGVRYILPVLPLFFIAASRIAGSHRIDVKSTDRVENWYAKIVGAIMIVLCLWQSVEIGLAAPHYLSYFNEIAGGSKGGPRYLIDSNVDWGQDLPGLKREMDKLGIKELGLLYFGHADPKLYGIQYHLPRRGDDFVAVSVNFLYGYPYSLTYLEKWSHRPPMVTDENNLDSFLFARSLLPLEPAERIGGSIYLYDLRGITW